MADPKLTRKQQLQSMVTAATGAPPPPPAPQYDNPNNTLAPDLTPHKTISVTDPNPHVDPASTMTQDQVMQYIKNRQNPQPTQPQVAQPMAAAPGATNPQVTESGSDNGDYDQQLQMKLQALRKLQASGQMGQ